MENISHDEKKALLKEFNHRINNDLQALLAFIKLKKRFGIDNGNIINFSSVSISSISAIQNLMYNSDDENNFINVAEFFEELAKILNDYYAGEGIVFSNETGSEFIMNPKKVFHVMFLINEMVNLSIDLSLNGASEKKISFSIGRNGDECLLKYSDSGSGIADMVSESDMKIVLFEQMVKQVNGNLESSDSNSVVLIKFNHD